MVTYRNGLKEGIAKQYYLNGQPFLEMLYRRDQDIGPVSYDQWGNLIMPPPKKIDINLGQ